MIKIIIVDDHILFREGLASILRSLRDLQISSMVGTVKEAIEAARAVKPDIILMDYNLPDGTGAEATRAILQVLPDCKVVFMTMSDRDEDLLAAIRSGAVGYLLKNMSPSKLIDALRAVQKGESALSRSMTLKVMKEFSRTTEPETANDPHLASLTRREKDVLVEIAAGKSNQEISKKLFISENTVKYHVHSILDKLDLSDRKQVAKFVQEHGIVK
jgi:DNA-binding NarL/FixJ family response regulator